MKNLRKYYVLTLALSLALGSCEKEEPLEQISELEDVALGEDTGLEVDAKLDALLDKELRGKTYMLNDAGEQVSSEDFFKKKARSQNTSWDPDRYDDVPNQSKILPISEYYKFGFFPNQNLSIAKAEKGAIKYLEEVKGLDLSYDLGYTKGYGQVTFSMASRSYNTDSPNNRPDLGYTPNLRVALYSDRQAPTQNNLGVWRIAGPGQIFKALPDRRIELNGTHSTFRTTKTTSVKKGNTQGLNYTASGTLEWEAKALFASVKQSATISIGGDNTWTNESQTIDTETSTFHLKYAKGDFVPKGQKCLFQPYKKKVRYEFSPTS